MAHFGREGGNAPPLSQVFGMRHDAEAFNSFIVLTCYSAQSLYLLGCLSSFAEPPLVGLTFGLRQGLAPCLRSRRYRRAAAYAVGIILLSRTLLPSLRRLVYQSPFTSHSLSRSVTGTCTLLASYASKYVSTFAAIEIFFSFADTLTATTRSGLAPLLTKP